MICSWIELHAMNWFLKLELFDYFINSIINSLITSRMMYSISYTIAADRHSIAAIRSPCNCFDDMGHGSATEDAYRVPTLYRL